MKYIFFLILFCVHSPLFSFSEKDVMSCIEHGLKQCESVEITDPLYENAQQMIDVLKTVKRAGKPKRIIFSEKNVVYMSPVFDRDNTFIDVLYFDHSTCMPQNWPSPPAQGKRTESLTLEQWNTELVDADFYKTLFIPGYFQFPHKNINRPPVFMKNVQRKWAYSITYIGIPFTENIKEHAYIIPGIFQFPRSMNYDTDHLRKMSEKYGVTFTIPEDPPDSLFKCVYNAAAMMANWWNIVEGNGKRVTYKDMFSGRNETGLDPRILESIYYRNNSNDPIKFPFVERFLVTDLITGELFPRGIEGVCQILCNDKRSFVRDPLFSRHIHRYSKHQFGTELQYIKIAERGAGNEQKIIDALHKYGPLLAGKIERYLGVPINIPVHAMVICGYVKSTLGTLFVFKETKGNYISIKDNDINNKYDGIRLFPSDLFYEIYAFPHMLRPECSIKDDQVFIQFKNRRHIVKPVKKLSVTDNTGKYIQYVQQEHAFLIKHDTSYMYPLKISWECEFYNSPEHKNEYVLQRNELL